MSEQIQFEIGDRVWSVLRRQWGDVDEHNGYVWVRFDGDDTNLARCDAEELFFEEIVIPPSARTRPTPKHEFKPGDPVCVRNKGEWAIRAFVREIKDGKGVECVNYDSGKPIAWSECRPYDRTLLGFEEAK